MTSPRPTRTPDGSGALKTLGLTYAAALLFGAVGAFIGSIVPCSGFLCNVGYAALGAVIGVFASAPVAAIAARRNGVRWWYTVVAYGLPVLALVMLLTAGSVIESPPEIVLFIMAAAAPIVGILVAAPGDPRWRIAAIAVIVVALLVAPFIQDQLSRNRWDEERRTAIVRWQAAGHPVYAPVGTDGTVVQAVSVRDATEHLSASAMYDLTVPGVDGEVRVWHIPEPDGSTLCDPRQPYTDLGDGIRTRGTGDDVVTVCRSFDGITVGLTNDGPGGWEGQPLVDLARSLELTDTAWLTEHLRER